MKIFKYKNFVKWAKAEKVSDATLVKVVEEINAGLIDADLGSGLIKKRIARPGKGKSGGYRALLAFRRNKRVFFLYGFAKNQRENIDATEKEAYADLAKQLLNLDDKFISAMLKANTLKEVIYGQEK